MIRIVAVAIAFAMAASLGVSGAMAQSQMDKPAMKSPATKPMEQGTDKSMDQKTDKMSQKIEGTVKTVTPNGMVTLEDGTKLSIPKSVMVPKEQLKPGAVISAEYQEKGGQKVATSVQIKG
jgi:Ni/Co efflux regulator RcnB